MKILQVCPYNFNRPGGVKTHIVGLSDALSKKGHDVKIVVPRQSVADSYDLGIHSFGSNVGLAFGGTQIDINICLGREWRRLKQFIKEEEFDVVHYHTIWNPFLSLQIRSIFRGHQVATFHDTPSDSLVGRFLRRWIMPLMGKIIFRWLDQMISVSETQKKCIARFSNRNVQVISNGIAPLKSSQKVSKYKDQKFNLLFLGRLEPRKGIMEAIQAFEIFSEKIPTSRLIVAGEGRELDNARNYCDQNKLNQVEFLEHVTEQEKRNLLSTTDVFVASAKYGESFGIVLLEAMQAGVPLVGYANDGYKELLTEEQLEYFVRPGDISGLSRAILKVRALQNPEGLRELGRIHASDFEWGKLVDQVERLYEA